MHTLNAADVSAANAQSLNRPAADAGASAALRAMRRLALATALTGGPLFLLGTILHPARDGPGIAAAGDLYAITHGLQALGLLLQALCLISIYALGARRFGRGGLTPLLAALVGTLLWFGLIVIDGSRNPAVARYAPEIVHTPADVSVGVAIVVLPALLLFPLGYLLFGGALARRGAAWAGVLLGLGALVYTSGGLAIFALGPWSPLIQALEVAGAAPYALGFVLLGHQWGPVAAPGTGASP
jgi:hypothetical protein